MALGILFVCFVIMSLLAIIGAALLFLVKNQNANDVLLVVMAAYSLTIAFLCANAQPVNFVGAQVLAWVIGLVAAGAVAFRFIAKKPCTAVRVLVAASVLLGIYGLYFG